MTQPAPAALVESLRAFGYSLRTAVADLIDNSISAKAKNVWARFEWDGKHSYIVIKDDGEGMTEAELVSAMRPGSKSPLEERSPKDLGRFGLGLKTASFSQCRRLSVVSKTAKCSSVSRCWDLDYINDSHEWRLLKRFNPPPLHIAKETLDGAGTVILWEKMDRVTGNTSHDDNNAYKRFLEAIDEVREHLAMVFHRYLEKPSGLKMWINGRQIEAWDPFLKTEKATQELPPTKLLCDGQYLMVTPYILPHQSKISKETHKNASGPQGWNAQQGFYVYRNERLLVAGDWLGLGFQKEEHYKLARIQIDLPNSMDSEWQIDVKKSRAKPPGYLRADLRSIGKLAREHAVQIYRHRGKVNARKSSQDHIFLWQQKVRYGKYFYSINREHPLIAKVFLDVGRDSIEPLLKMLEETIPSAHIMITSSEEPEKIGAPFEDCTYDEIKPIIESLYFSFLSSGCTKEDAFSRLIALEPFNYYPEFIETFKNQIEGE
ncbi:MAG: ATP-binding protein [Gammaproteobacteria bacterium]|nr:ATP-binding protein [Gammaproteobacteria bacterium]